MSTTLQRLAGWARDLSPADLPPAVRVRARLQHLSLAGAIRSAKDLPIAGALRKAGSNKGAASLITGGTSTARDALRLHAALSTVMSYDDPLFMAHTGPGGVCGAWTAAKGHSLDELLCATVVANEIAGRLGASLLLGPGQDEGCSVVHAAAAAAAIGWLEGLSADELAHALALAIADGPVVPMATLVAGGAARGLVAANPAVRGADAVAYAKAGVRGSLSLLDDRDGLLSALSWVPLKNAFTGLGKAWLTETLSFKLMPGSTFIQVPVQAAAEVLRRHVKAADKRLRAEQIDRIEISVGAASWANEQLVSEHPGLDTATVQMSARRAIGALVVAYEFGPAQLDQAWLNEHSAEIADMASRVEISHSWSQTLTLVDHITEVAAPLFAGVTLSELAVAARESQRTMGVRLPKPTAADLVAFARHRPDRFLERTRRASGDLGDARLVEWQPLFGAELRLHTTRGGAWPEVRTMAEGAPGWPWDKTVAGVLRKYAAGEEGALERGTMLSEVAGTEDAEGWCKALFGH